MNFYRAEADDAFENVAIDLGYSWYHTEDNETLTTAKYEELLALACDRAKAFNCDPTTTVLYEIYTTYAESTDMTFILQDKLVIENGCVEARSTEVIGWYFGEPALTLTAKYAGQLKAEY